MPVTTYCDVVGFLLRSFQAMACFFNCFGIRNSHLHHHHHPRRRNSPTSNAPVVVQEEVRQKTHLSSRFTAKDENGAEKQESVVKERENENLVHRVGRFEVSEDLVEEAKFLKACGTLPETPAEIRKRVTIVENSDIRKPQIVLESSVQTPDKTQQEETVAENLERSDLQSFQSALESSPVTPDEIQNVEIPTDNSVKLGTNKSRSVMETSPYSTPTKITDDMQTPGTVFATNMKSLTKGNGRIRSQYVYTVLNPIENLCQLDELKGESFVINASDHKEEYLSTQRNATPFPEVGSSDHSVKDEKLGEISLSSWLKPPSAKNYRKPNIGKSPEDRPIIGLVAAHWNPLEEASHISPKGWDGNGIPNSTTKYKEDQKVRWHATPFEERLEKALSEEAIPQRKLITGEPIKFEEMEGKDTATSHLQSMTCPKSVVSF